MCIQRFKKILLLVKTHSYILRLRPPPSLSGKSTLPNCKLPALCTLSDSLSVSINTECWTMRSTLAAVQHRENPGSRNWHLLKSWHYDCLCVCVCVCVRACVRACLCYAYFACSPASRYCTVFDSFRSAAHCSAFCIDRQGKWIWMGTW